MKLATNLFSRSLQRGNRLAQGDPDRNMPAPPDGVTVMLWLTDLDQLAILGPLTTMLTQDGDPISLVALRPAGEKRPVPRIESLIVLEQNDPSEVWLESVLENLQPALFIWVGMPVTPSLVRLVVSKGVDCVLVEAELSGSSVRPGQFLRKRALRNVLSQFETVFTRDADTAETVSQLAPNISTFAIGVLDRGGQIEPADDVEQRRLLEILGTRPIWLAVAVPEEEFAIVLSAYRRAARHAHRLVLVMIPKQPEITARWEAFLCENGLQSVRAETMERIGEPTQAITEDRTDLAELWYRIAPTTYLGGSFAGDEIPDPYPVAALGSAIIHGPRTAAYAAILEQLGKVDGASLSKSMNGLGEVVAATLSPDRSAQVAHAAWNAITEGSEATLALVRHIQERLDEREGPFEGA